MILGVGCITKDLEIATSVGSIVMAGTLTFPQNAEGVVLFAHGSGSGRFSPRNLCVANIFQQHGLATLLVDLLTEEEAYNDRKSGRLRFNIGLLASRLLEATKWLEQYRLTRFLKIGYFGASTGAGAALVAAAERPQSVYAVVSRGGRPDLAGEALQHVQSPTLLIVGSQDAAVIELNHKTIQQLNTEKCLEIIPGATHLFEEPGALEQVGQLAYRWFNHYLGIKAAF